MFAVTFDEWRAGEHGQRGSYGTAPQYHAVNLQVYDNGSIGPRPDWRTLTQTGSIGATSDVPLGAIWRNDSSETPDANGNTYGGILVVLTRGANQLHYFGQLDGNGGITWDGSAYSVGSSLTPTNPEAFPSGYGDPVRHWLWNDGQEITIVGGTIFNEYDTSTPDFARPNPNGYASGAVIYRDRAYYWGFSANPGRIYYSDAADWATVDSLSFFDVAPDSTSKSTAVVGMWPINNALVIARKDGRWSVLSGVSPETGSHRELFDSRVPEPGMDAALFNDELMFTTGNGWGINVADAAGIDVLSLRHLRPSQPDFRQTVTDAGMNNSPVVDQKRQFVYFPARPNRSAEQAETYAAALVNGVWNYESETLSTPEALYYSGGDGGRIYAVTVDANGATYGVRSRDFTLNRPGKNTDANSTRHTFDDGYTLQLAEIPAPLGKQIRVRRIDVDFDYWNETGYASARMDVTTTLRGISGAANPELVVDGTRRIQDNTDGEANWDATTNDLPARRTSTLMFAETAYGTSAQVEFELGAVAIRKVTVYLDEREIEPGT